MKHIQFYNENLNTINRKMRNGILYESESQQYKLSSMEHNTHNDDIVTANAYLKNYKRLFSIEWKFIFLDADHFIENTFPHTHSDTIFLHSNHFNLRKKSRISTIIHEKIHVYQRLFPIPYHKMLFDVYKLKIHSYLPTHPKIDQIRKNPDNNWLVYKDGNEIILPLIKENATTLSDVVYTKLNNNKVESKYASLPLNEHPNETFAYFITEMILTKNVPYDIKIFL